eukprot:gene12264-15410_t
MNSHRAQNGKQSAEGAKSQDHALRWACGPAKAPGGGSCEYGWEEGLVVSSVEGEWMRGAAGREVDCPAFGGGGFFLRLVDDDPSTSSAPRLFFLPGREPIFGGRYRRSRFPRGAFSTTEATVAAQQKKYVLLQKQYEGALSSQDKLLEVHSGQRMERDELWAEADRLKADVAILTQERDELSAKLNALRNEHNIVLAEVRFEYEQRLSDLNVEGEHKISNLLEVSDRLKREMEDAMRSSEKHKGTVAHLKEQIKEVLIARDDLEREVLAERDFSAELNHIVNQIKRSGADISSPRPPIRRGARPGHH